MEQAANRASGNRNTLATGVTSQDRTKRKRFGGSSMTTWITMAILFILSGIFFRHLDLLLHPHSEYIAEMVGVNLLKGRVVSTDASLFHTISLSKSDEKGLEVIAISQNDAQHTTTLTPQQEVSVVVDPRSITLHQSKPESSARNVFRGEIIQIVPISAAFSETDKKMEGIMRVSMLIDPSLPPLTADITVSSSTHMDLSRGKVVYASFKATETREYV